MLRTWISMTVHRYETYSTNIPKIDVQFMAMLSSAIFFILYLDKIHISLFVMYIVFFQHGLVAGSLDLALACLSYDFIGTSNDETSDDLSTVHLPTSWRKALLDFSLMQLLFDLYKCLPPTLSAVVCTNGLTSTTSNIRVDCNI